MSTSTSTPQAVVGGPRPELDESTGKPSGLTVVGRVFASELIKLRSVRSTGIVLVLAALSLIVVGLVNAVHFAVTTREPGSGDPAAVDPLDGAMSGVGSAVAAVAVLGVLSVTADYSSGMIRTTLAAVPRRGLVVLGKIGALAALVFPISLGSALLTFVADQAILASTGVSISLWHPGVARAILGTGLYLTVLAVFAAGLGWLIRSTAGTLGCWLTIWILPSFVSLLLPPATAARIEPYLPGNVGRLITEVSGSGEPAAWGSLAIFVGYAAVITGLGAAVLRRRDA